MLMDLVKVGSSIRTNPSHFRIWTPTRLVGPELLKVPIFVSSTLQAVLLSLMLGTIQFSHRVRMESEHLISTSRTTKTVGSRFHQSGSEENQESLFVSIDTATAKTETAQTTDNSSLNHESPADGTMF